MCDEPKFQDEIDENKNKNKLQCQYCNSLILRSMKGVYVENEFTLPLMHQKNKKSTALVDLETETLMEYWQIDDMFTFENIGFSNTVDNTKYLICADCEMGPIGYHDIATKKNFVALNRVKHVT